VYPLATVEAYRNLMQAAVRGDHFAMTAAARTIGYFDEHIHDQQRDAVVVSGDTVN